MLSTHVSLLTEACSGSDRAWVRLVDLYQPLVYGWLRRQGVVHHDAEELTQDVLATVVQELDNFEHRGRTGGFRRWLREITVHRSLGFWRAGRLRTAAAGGSGFDQILQQLESSDSQIARKWDQEHDQFVLRQLLDRMTSQFDRATITAFRRLTFDEAEPELVARELGISIGAAYSAKSRVLRRLREEAAGLVDEDLMS
jgi:RNA polymerase sigma-70 factor (ECF subfamily)